MMLLHRWAVAGVLGAVTLSASVAGQAPKAPAKPPSKIIQPDDGPPPDQAQQPDQAAPLDSSVPPEPAVTLPDPLAEEEAPAPAPAPVELPRPTETSAPVDVPEAAAPVAAATPEQRQLQLDAEHLLQLVQALKVEVDKAGSNTLSLEAVRKADEVQRLSKSLRERVRVWTAPGK